MGLTFACILAAMPPTPFFADPTLIEKLHMGRSNRSDTAMAQAQRQEAAVSTT